MSIPSSCKALQLEKAPQKGERNIAAVRTVPVPSSDPAGFVLLRMHAAGFNRRDEWGMLGQYPGLIYQDSTFGCDGVGTIVRGGSSSKTLKLLVPTRGWESDEAGPEAELPQNRGTKNALGGKGFGLLGCTGPTGGKGTFVEYVQIEERELVDVPAHLDAVQAACLPCGGVTAYRALFTKGRVGAGHNVLITGIGGGVALLALQLAVAAGASVYVTGGSQQKVDRAVELGARGGVLYKDKNWPADLAKLVQKTSSQRPYLDAVIDSAGGDVPVQAAKAGLKAGGRVVCFGMTAVPKMTFTMREVLRNVEVLGEQLNARLTVDERADLRERTQARRWEAHASSGTWSPLSESTRSSPSSTRSSMASTMPTRAS